MVRKLIVRLIVALALLIPSALSAQTFIQKPFESQTFVQKPPVQTSLSVTLNPAGAQPAKLKYTSATQTLDAHAESVTMTWDAGGLVAEMSFGEYTSTTGNWAQTGKNGFKTLEIRFAPSGELISAKASR